MPEKREKDVTDSVPGTIQDRERMLAHTIKSVSECVSITDTSDNIIFINDAFLRTYGYTEEELLGKKMNIVRSKNNDQSLINQILPATINGGWKGELYNKKKDGTEFLIHLSTSVIRDEKGQIICLVGICKDITESKQADLLLKKQEDELRASRKVFKNYFENTSIGMCITSPEKGWIEVNNRLCNMFGYSRDEFSGLTWEVLTHPDDLSADNELFSDVLDGKIDNYELDKRFIRKDNSILDTTIYVAAERNGDGSVKHIHASLVDITYRKKAEETLRDSETKFRELTNLLPVAIFETDLQGKLTYTNKAGFEWFEYTLDDIARGLSIFEILGESQINYAFDRFRYILKSRSTSSGEYALTRKDGSVFDALIISSLIESNGHVIGIRGVVNDISDKKKADELKLANEAAEILIKSQRHLSLLVDQSLVGFIEVENNMIVKSWNPSAERIFGYTAVEAIGKDLTKLVIEPAERSRIKINLKKIRESRKGYKNINRNITKDGRQIICEWHDTALVDTDGQVLSVVSLVADITERVEAEQMLTESREKLKQFAVYLQNALEEERVQISRDMHDCLGQSMTGLKMNAFRLHSKIVKNNEVSLATIASEVQEMINVINSVMQSIRKIAQRLRPRILDDMGLIAAIESQLEEFNQQSGIIYNLDKQIEVIPIERKHKIEVYRIFQEALTNIIRHSKATMVSISIYGTQSFSFIEIIDNGIGIGEINIMKSNTLGMLGMKERTNVFGGNLEFYGVPGKGTKIVLQIPVIK